MPWAGRPDGDPEQLPAPSWHVPGAPEVEEHPVGAVLLNMAVFGAVIENVSLPRSMLPTLTTKTTFELTVVTD